MLCVSPFSDGSLIRSLKECKDEKLSGYAVVLAMQHHIYTNGFALTAGPYHKL